MALSSVWDGLNPHLIARFWAVNYKGEEKNDGQHVRAPLSEAQLDVSLNWQSPFENMNLDSKAPAITGLMQGGAFMDAAKNMKDAGGGGAVEGMVGMFEGRTGITKLNSTQIFYGMPPVKIQCTAVFRAYADAMSEVEEPFNQLMSWALPVELAKDMGSGIADAYRSVAGGNGMSGQQAINVVLPSSAPTPIAMLYKGRTFKPLVIEQISQPLASPIDKDGQFMQLVVPMTLCSLTAIDRKDWRGFQPF